MIRADIAHRFSEQPAVPLGKTLRRVLIKQRQHPDAMRTAP
jgi:hypothetical protein